MAIGSSSRGGARVRLVCIHTAEGARTARSLAAYFDQPGVNASSHVCIDANEMLWIVDRHRAAWTLLSGNSISMNAEMCGFARWTREQWFSTGWVDGCWNPKAMMDRTIDWIRGECDYWGIPKNKLKPFQLPQGVWGFIHHDDWTKGMRDGSHWDVGTGFPFDYAVERLHGRSQEDDMQLDDVVGKRPDGSDFTVRDVFFNGYLNRFSNLYGYHTPSTDDLTRADVAHLVRVAGTRYPAVMSGGETNENGEWTADTGEYVRAVYRQVEALTAQVTGLSAAVAALSEDGGLNAAEVERIIRDAVAQHVEITGTVQIGPAQNEEPA